jgi:hypothetical protein
VGSFSIVAIGTYATSANFHQPRDTTHINSGGCCLENPEPAFAVSKRSKRGRRRLRRGLDPDLEQGLPSKGRGAAAVVEGQHRQGGRNDLNDLLAAAISIVSREDLRR